MLSKKMAVWYLAVFMILLPFASAEVGIINPVTREVMFQPNLEVTFDYIIVADVPVRFAAEGDFNESVVFSKDSFDLGPKKETKTVSMTIKLPADATIFGKRELFFTVYELIEGGRGGAFARSAVADRVNIIVPYPGKYIEGDLKINAIRVDQVAQFDMELFNIGTDNIQEVKSIFRIFDGDVQIAEIRADPISIQSKERKTVSVTWDTAGINPGIYTIKAHAEYDGGKTLDLTGSLMIGDILIKITGYSQNFIKNKINPFTVNISSFWNEAIHNVYAKIDVYENESVKEVIQTPNLGISAWSNRILKAYLDTSELSLGEHKVNINVYYADKIASEEGTIYVEEEPRLPVLANVTMLLIGIIIIFIVLNTIILVKFVRRRKDEKK